MPPKRPGRRPVSSKRKATPRAKPARQAALRSAQSASALAASPPLPVSAQIAAQLKAGREQQEVVGPIVALLNNAGWDLAQMRYGRKEWQVPKRPSEATKREKNRSFDGFPVDIIVFDAVTRGGDPHHAVFIVETKNPDEEAGVSQLESYMQLEPHAQLGVWSNNPDPSAMAVFVYRESNGRLLRRHRLLGDIPRPNERISLKERRLTFADLRVPSSETFQSVVKNLLDRVVADDTNITRSEERLDQLCGMLLLKLQSDKLGKLKPSEPPTFRLFQSAAATADALKRAYRELVDTYPDTFTTPQDRVLRFSDTTICRCTELLAPYRLIDVGVDALSTAFQVLRSEALKQGEGQYFTPQPVVDAGVRLLRVQLEDRVIDPACGTGGFLVGVLLEMQRRYPDNHAGIARWAQTNIFGIDKDSIGVKLTKAIMQIAGDGSAHCVRGDSVRKHLWTREYSHLMSNSFDDGRFTVVVTNPPFGAGLTVTAHDARLAGLTIAQSTRSAGWADLEIGLHFLQRAHQLLKVGGRLGIVLPETYFFSPSYDWLFGWLKPRLRPVVVANVPMEAFTPYCRAKTNFYVFHKIG